MTAADDSRHGRVLLRAQSLAERYGALDHVRAVALVGSLAAGSSDAASDMDLCVYATAPLSLSDRAAIAASDARAEIDNRWFGPEDSWIDSDTALVVDVVYRDAAWVERELARTLLAHEPRLGYSTTVWASVLTARPLVDPTGWFARLQQRAQQPYPEPLRRAVIAFNLPLLRQARSAYTRQIAQAVARDDRVSVNHRVAALLASYFDVLFALNRLPQPGEKRLVQLALTQCPRVPAAMPAQIAALLRAAGAPGHEVVRWAEALSADLEDLVQQGDN